MDKNISQVYNCFGCGVCATVCPQKIISVKLNNAGFYAPHITVESICTKCGLCTETCSFLHTEIALTDMQTHSYAAWSNNEEVRCKSSSGGIGFEIGKQLIEQGYKVCGVRYNVENAKAEHYIAATAEELIPSMGSKYIQSYTVDGFKAINRKEKNLVVGTPCQIDSFRRYIRKYKVEDNFVLMDFFCHAVPSMWAWQKYLQIVERKAGKVTYASWRNKRTGEYNSRTIANDSEEVGEKVNWHDSYNILIKTRHNSINSRFSEGNIFYRLFFGDYCCNPACQKDCKYKYKSSSADIRIGDLWGETYKDNEDGVSALISFTDKGSEIIKSIRGCTVIEHPFDVVAEGQMKENIKKANTAFLITKLLKMNRPIPSCIWKFSFFLEKIIRKFKHL